MSGSRRRAPASRILLRWGVRDRHGAIPGGSVAKAGGYVSSSASVPVPWVKVAPGRYIRGESPDPAPDRPAEPSAGDATNPPLPKSGGPPRRCLRNRPASRRREIRPAIRAARRESRMERRPRPISGSMERDRHPGEGRRSKRCPTLRVVHLPDRSHVLILRVLPRSRRRDGKNDGDRKAPKIVPRLTNTRAMPERRNVLASASSPLSRRY